MGFVIGSLATVATLASAARAPSPIERERETTRLPRCTVSLVLVGVDEGSSVSRAVDWKTGGEGFSHAYLDPCRLDASTGARVFIDYNVECGLHWTTNSYAGRGLARVYLDAPLGDEVFGCVSAKLGAPFNVAPLVAGVESDRTCSGLIVHCLPPALRRSLREAARWGRGASEQCVSPNDLAIFFGAELGQSVRASSRTGTDGA